MLILYISRTTALERCSGLYLLLKNVIFFKERRIEIFFFLHQIYSVDA
jgi:hypothetical protein